MTVEESLKMSPAAFRDRDLSGSQNPYDGEAVEIEAPIQTAVDNETQSQFAAADSPVANSNDDDVAPPRRAPPRLARRRTLLASTLAITIIAAVGLGARWWTVGRYMISTDDAYVGAHNTTLASKISGYVESIRVHDNATVHAGDVIATIDNGDYKLAVDAAQEKVATEQATVDRIGRQVVAQQANVD
jgi:membrane fusion protein (multidrug efflux system)